MKELYRRCRDLPKESKLRLIKALQESIAEEEREDDDARFEVLYKAAVDVCGKGILTRIRDRELAIGRWMISYKMRQEGFSLSVIARHLHRHHASIIHGIRMMQDAFDFKFKEEMALWERFIKKVEEYEKEISSAVV